MAKVVRTSGLKLYYTPKDTLVIEENIIEDTMSDTSTMAEAVIDTKDSFKESKQTEAEKTDEKTDEKANNENTTTDNTLKVEEKKDSLNKILFDLVLNKKSSKIITGVCLFSVLLFIVAYFVSLHNAGSIKTHYEKRRDNMQAMIDINIGKYQDKYLVDMQPFLNHSDSFFKGKSDNISLKEFKEHLDNFRKNELEFLQNQFKLDKNFSINQYVEVESSKLQSQIVVLEKKITEVDNKIAINEDIYTRLEGLKGKNLDDKINLSPDLKLDILYNPETTLLDFLKSYSNNPQTMDDFLTSNPGFEKNNLLKKSLNNIIKDHNDSAVNKQFIELLLSMFEDVLTKFDYSKTKSDLLFEKANLSKEIESLKKSKVSIEKYKQNKTYLFQKQFDINDDTIHYTIDKAISYMALYHALLIVILFYTAVMVICSLALGVKGWFGTDANIKLLAMATVVILVMSNLILVTLRPRENYVNYIANAEINESKQAKLIMFLNNYDKVNSVELDEFVNKNLDALTKFSEILPSTDESKLAKDVSKFTGSLN